MIFNKIIRIAQISSDNGRFKIKSSDGETYSFFQFKTGGRIPTQAYEHFMGNNHGEQFNQEDVALIGYTETPGTTKQGQSITYKNIVSMFPSEEQPGTQEPRQAPRPSNSPPREQTFTKEPNIESREAFGKRLAMHGMANSRLVNNTIEQVKQELPQLMDLELSIEATLSGQIDSSQIPF